MSSQKPPAGNCRGFCFPNCIRCRNGCGSVQEKDATPCFTSAISLDRCGPVSVNFTAPRAAGGRHRDRRLLLAAFRARLAVSEVDALRAMLAQDVVAERLGFRP